MEASSRAPCQVVTAPGWALQRLTPPSRLFGANGIRNGPDGRIYVAQVSGSQISAVDPDTAAIEAIVPFGGAIVAPDDLAFDEHGNLFVTELTEGRVAMREPNGAIRVIQGDMPVANPITYHEGHLIAGECRPGARILELDRNGGAPRVILDNVPMPNAFTVGPDGKLYIPVMGANEIWRVDLAGGAPEVVARGLGVPNSVKFDRHGMIVSTQVSSGQVLRIDPRTGSSAVLADIGAGLDNCTFVGDRLFVSHMTGSIHEISAPGEARPLVDSGLQWPMGLAVAADGAIYIGDGSFGYRLAPGGKLDPQGMLFTPGYPGFIRGVAVGAEPGEWIVTTANGGVHRYWPDRRESLEVAGGFDRLMDVAVAPGGTMVFAEWGAGRVHAASGGNTEVLAHDLDRPVGVAVAAGGDVYVSESGAGRVIVLRRGAYEIVLDGFDRPEGIAIDGENLFVLDAGTRELVTCRLDGKDRRTLASGLPVSAPEGAVRTYLGAVGVLAGPMVSFSGLAVSPDGSIVIAADAEGSILAVSRTE